MASVSEMPFRVLAMDLGAALAPTELISAKGIFYKNRRTFQYLTYDPIKEVPYSVQLFGGDIDVKCKYAKKVKSMFRKAFPSIPIVITKRETAEMTKYFINCFF